MSSELTAVLDRTNTSSRNAVYILAAAAKSLGHDTNLINLSHRAIHRSRIEMRKQIAKDLKERHEIVDSAVLHWDGKLLPDISGIDKVDRLPIVLSGLNYEQLLGVPKLHSATGSDQAKIIVDTLNQWNVAKNIKGMCFDTAYVNTGETNGAGILIEEALKTKLLWFPCRHHIYELVLRAVVEVVWPVSSGPNSAVFNRFQRDWNTFDKLQYEIGIDDQCVMETIKDKKDDILNFISFQMQEFQPRDDYKELLELAYIFLGGVPSRGIKFKTPGAMHHARWLAKAIYCLKMFMFKKQFHLGKQELKGLRIICIFIVTIYIKVWFTAPNSIQAPFQDFMCLKDLINFSHISPKFSKAACTKFTRHLWYLSEDLVILSLFDERVPLDVKSKMVEAIKSRESTTKNTRKLVISQNDLKSFSTRNVSDFVSKKSMILFEKFNLPSNFLDLPPDQWQADQTFQHSLKILQAIKVVNDIAERGVSLIHKYNQCLTYDEDQKQYLLQVVNNHRTQYPNCNKNNLC